MGTVENTILAPVILLIDLVTGNFDKLKTDASNIWTNIKDAAQTIWTGIKQVVSALAKGLVTAVTTLFTGFRDTVSKSGILLLRQQQKHGQRSKDLLLIMRKTERKRNRSNPEFKGQSLRTLG